MITALQKTIAIILITGTTAHAATEVERLLSDYEQIETVTCQTRRIVDGQHGKIRFFSRIYFTNRDQLHAENITPVRRRTIANGDQLWQYAEGDPKGFSRPISELSEEMLIALRRVPGTAMDHLLRLKGAEEKRLQDAEDENRQFAYEVADQHVVLTIDSMGRLVEVTYYDDASYTNPRAKYSYSNWSEPLNGIWIPLRYEAFFESDHGAVRESFFMDRFVANQPIAASLFDPTTFFADKIDFVSDFSEIHSDL